MKKRPFRALKAEVHYASAFEKGVHRPLLLCPPNTATLTTQAKNSNTRSETRRLVKEAISASMAPIATRTRTTTRVIIARLGVPKKKSRNVSHTVAPFGSGQNVCASKPAVAQLVHELTSSDCQKNVVPIHGNPQAVELPSLLLEFRSELAFVDMSVSCHTGPFGSVGRSHGHGRWERKGPDHDEGSQDSHEDLLALDDGPAKQAEQHHEAGCSAYRPNKSELKYVLHHCSFRVRFLGRNAAFVYDTPLLLEQERRCSRPAKPQLVRRR